jgi:hypothetical protein
MSRIRRPLVCVLVPLTLFLTACGGGGSDETEQIETTLQEALLADDPAKCTELMTADYRDQVASEEGAAALRECEEEVEESSVEDPEALRPLLRRRAGAAAVALSSRLRRAAPAEALAMLDG